MSERELDSMQVTQGEVGDEHDGDGRASSAPPASRIQVRGVRPIYMPEQVAGAEPQAGSSWERRVRWVVAVVLVLAGLIGGVAVGPGVMRLMADVTQEQVTSTGGVPVPYSLIAVEHAGRALDSLDAAVVAYNERRLDFLARRIDCAALAAGYAAADSLLVRAADLVRVRRDSLNASTLGRYGRTLSSMDRVNGDFDRSGCARP